MLPAPYSAMTVVPCAKAMGLACAAEQSPVAPMNTSARAAHRSPQVIVDPPNERQRKRSDARCAVQSEALDDGRRIRWRVRISQRGSRNERNGLGGGHVKGDNSKSDSSGGAGAQSEAAADCGGPVGTAGALLLSARHVLRTMTL